MPDPLRVVAVGYEEPPLGDRDEFAVEAAADASEATATLETSAVDCVVSDGEHWKRVRSTLGGRFPDVPTVVYAGTDAVDVEQVTAEATAFVPREAGETLLGVRLPELTAVATDEAALVDDSSVRFQSLAESVGVGVLSIDPDSVIQFANPAVEELLGWSPAELEGESLGVLIPDRLRAAHFEGMRTYLETGERNLDWSGMTLPAEHADGHEVEVTVSFGEFEHQGERYFTGVVTPDGVGEGVAEELSAIHDRLAEVEERVDDEALAEAVEALEDVLERLAGA